MRGRRGGRPVSAGVSRGRTAAMPHASRSDTRRGTTLGLRRIAATLAVAALASGAAAAGADAATAPPPPVTVLTHGDVGHGDFFVSPFGGTDKYANGPEILDQDGNVVWFHDVPAGQEAADF